MCSRMKMNKLKSLKSSTKITILYLFLSLLLLAVLIPTVYHIVEYSLRESLIGNMEASEYKVESALKKENGIISVNRELLTDDDIKPGIYIQVLDKDGEILYQSRDAYWIFELVKEEEESEKEWSYLSKSKEFEGEELQIEVLGSIYFNDFLSDFIWILLLLAPCYMLLAGIGARLLAQRALRPVREITEAAKKISQGDFSERIEGISSKDEVGELAESFNRMVEELEISFRRERRFTSDASHELRTPMAVIAACAEDALHTEDPAIKEENIKAIQKENEHMTKMVSQLLMLSRGYEGRYHFQPEELGLYDMVESVSESLSMKAEEKGIRIHNEVGEEEMIYADQSLFTQLLVNLMENAIKYGKEKGNIWIAMEKRGEQNEIYIRDDGIGISSEDLPEIFERFYRADKARDRSGSGLGLAIVKWIVKLHGAEIYVKSEPDGGSEFMLYGFGLPMED